MNEFLQMLMSSYSSDELVDFFEVEPNELISMIQECCPEKFEENLYKFNGTEEE